MHFTNRAEIITLFRNPFLTRDGFFNYYILSSNNVINKCTVEIEFNLQILYKNSTDRKLHKRKKKKKKTHKKEENKKYFFKIK